MRNLGSWPRRAVLFVFVVGALAPLYWTIVTSLKNQVDVYDGPKYVPFLDFHPTLASWQSVLGAGTFLSMFLNSVVFSTVSSALAVSASGFAYVVPAKADCGVLPATGVRVQPWCWYARISTRLPRA